MNLRSLLGVDLPLIQAPMAGVQGSALAAAVTNAGGLGSLPAVMLTPEGLRAELTALRGLTAGPVNVNFFCHRTPAPDAEREAAWRRALEPYYRELGLDPAAAPPPGGRTPFSAEAADVLAEFRPAVV